MRIAVYSLTRDRLEYTKRSFESLRKLAGCGYDHFVVDQGSIDETPEWLKNEYRPHWLVLLPENVGIARGANMALDAIFSQGDWDLVVKMDNDCLVQSENLLKQIVEVFASVKPLQSRFMLSPRVEGIQKQPRRVRDIQLAGRRVGITGIIGGLFHVLPGDLYKQYRYDTSTPRGAYNDPKICSWFRGLGGETGYIEGLVVEHMDTTAGQVEKHPGYHERKQRELREDK